MTTQFQHWTERVTGGTGDLFTVGCGEGFDVMDHRLGWFTLFIVNEKTDDFDLYHEFSTKLGWKNAYRLARVVKKYGKK